MLAVFPRLVASPTFYLLTIVVVVACLVPTILYAVYRTSRSTRMRGLLESREESISELMFSPVQPVSPILPVGIVVKVTMYIMKMKDSILIGFDFRIDDRPLLFLGEETSPVTTIRLSN